MSDARKPLIFKAFRASLTLVPARYIAPRDAELFGDLALCAGHPAAEAVTRDDDLFLPLGQALVHEPSHAQAVVAVLNVQIHRVLDADDIAEIQGIPLGARLQRVAERHLPLHLPLRPKMHEDFIRYPLLTDT